MNTDPFLKKEEKKEELMNKVGRRDDLSDLPPELLAQLRTSKHLNTEHQEILDVVKDRKDPDGIANIDEIVIDLYRKYKSNGFVDYPSKTVTQIRINKLLKDGHLHRVEGRRGIYSIKPN